MQQYLDLCQYILDNGVKKEDRTGTGTLSVFGYQTRYDLRKGFPLVTTKHVNFDKIKGELLWFLSGSTNANECADKFGFKTWKLWADDNGELGPIYSKQWRDWEHDPRKRNGKWTDNVDQINEVIKSIKNNPDSRRHIVSAWNVGELDQMALPPCHLLFQFYVANGELSCQLYQRSADVFLGIPFNISSYALLISMIAQVTNLKPGEFIHTIGDAHIYLNHIEQVKTQLQRETKPLPTLHLNPNITDIDDFTMHDIWIENYEHHPKIKGNISV